MEVWPSKPQQSAGTGDSDASEGAGDGERLLAGLESGVSPGISLTWV